MFIIRSPKDQDHPFTQVSNSFIYDSTLSLKSKALLIFLLSKPDSWCFNYPDILKYNKIGIKSIKSAIKELISAGFISTHQHRNNDGRFLYYNYTVYETSFLSSSTKTTVQPERPFRLPDKRQAEKPLTDITLPAINKNKIILKKKTATSSTKVVNTNVVAVSPKSAKKKEECMSLCSFLNVINPNHLIEKYGLDEVFAAAILLRDSNRDVINPTGFIVVCIKENWKKYKPPPEKPKKSRQKAICPICVKWFYYLDYKPTRKFCNSCLEKKA